MLLIMKYPHTNICRAHNPTGTNFLLHTSCLVHSFIFKDQILYFYFSFITSQLHYRLMSRPNTAQENKITITMTKNRIVSVLSVKPCLVNCNNVLYPIWHSSKMYLLCISLWNNNTANIFNVFWIPHMVKQIDQPDVNFYKQPSEPQKQ